MEPDSFFNIDPLDADLGAFYGAFISEGHLSENSSIKITCKNLDFINCATGHARKVFGEAAATGKKPTKEHKYRDMGFHKYYRKNVAVFLSKNYGTKPGRKIINNEGLPELVMNNSGKRKVKEWFINYMRMRLSGDGHIRNSIHKGKDKNIITRRVALSRNNSLFLEKGTLEIVKKNYGYRKLLSEYPEKLFVELKKEMKNKRNFPKEFLDIKKLMKNFFDIKSKIYPYGIRCIYFDSKRKVYIVSAIYKIVISRKDDIIKFRDSINFANFDTQNKNKLIKLVNSYKK